METSQAIIARMTALNNHISKILDLQSVSEKFKSQLMRLNEQQQNERAQQGAEYYLSQLSPFNSLLSSLLEVEIDNKETRKNVDQSGKDLTEALKVKIACLHTVKEKGYSVQGVQKAKVEVMIGQEKNTSMRIFLKTTATADGTLSQNLPVHIAKATSVLP